MQRQLARLRDKAQRLRQLHARQTRPLNMRLWRYVLTEDMGATTAHQANAILVTLEGATTSHEATVVDVLQCLSAVESGYTGICAQQIDMDGQLFYVPICCEDDPPTPPENYCPYCVPPYTSGNVLVELPALSNVQCDECAEFAGWYTLGYIGVSYQWGLPARCVWSFATKPDFCQSGYEFQDTIYSFRIDFILWADGSDLHLEVILIYYFPVANDQWTRINWSSTIEGGYDDEDYDCSSDIDYTLPMTDWGSNAYPTLNSMPCACASHGGFPFGTCDDVNVVAE